MRSIWNGSISFGLVNVPVKLYGATEEHDITTHQVHTDCGGRIRYLRVCEACGGAIEYRDISKQYELNEENGVILTNDDLAEIAAEKDQTISVVEFVPDTISPLLYEQSYYLAPANLAALKSYKMLSAALARSERVAVVTFSLRSKTRLAALKVTGKQNVLTLNCLRWPDEVREAHFPVLDKDVKVSDKELAAADVVIEAMFNEFNPDRYKDTYQVELRALIERKAEDQGVNDMLKKLEASVKKGKK